MKYIGVIFIMCGCVTLSYLYEKREKNKITYLHKMKDFIYNPYRKIIDMIPIFVDKNIPQLLMNGYN